MTSKVHHGPNIKVVALAMVHIDDVMRLDATVFSKPWSRDLWDNELGDSSRVHIVAMDGSSVVGHAGIMTVVDDVHVTTIAVEPASQGNGIASMLLAELLESAVAAGSRAATLEVRAGDRRAQRLYSRFGFVPAGVRRGYYSNPTDDAIIMWVSDFDDPDWRQRMEQLRSPAAADHTAGRRETILGIETSCDETAAAVVRGGSTVLSSVVSSQIDIHARFGGVVPEVASRAHVEAILPVVDSALSEAGIAGTELDAVAVTHGPGLVGALLVGVSAAKAMSLAWNVPLIGVNHLEAHLYAAFLDEPDLEMPLVVLLVSGGHTMLVVMEDHLHYRVLGSTLDDAAGEAFDKVARHVGLGYPGGPIIDRISLDGDASAIRFPRAMQSKGWDFSFSGLKTSVVNHLRKHPDTRIEDLAASFQEAVVDVLVTKARRAAQDVGAKGICLAGGVAANSRLRQRVREVCESDGLTANLPSREMCTDNAAMVGAVAWHRLNVDGPSPLGIGADPSLRLPSV